MGIEARGAPSADVGCLLPTGASNGSGVSFARVGRLRSLNCRTDPYVLSLSERTVPAATHAS